MTAPKYRNDSSVRLGPGTSSSIEMWTESSLLVRHAGAHPVVLESDAFSTRTFEVYAVDHVEEYEVRVDQTPTVSPRAAPS